MVHHARIEEPEKNTFAGLDAKIELAGQVPGEFFTWQMAEQEGANRLSLSRPLRFLCGEGKIALDEA